MNRSKRIDAIGSCCSSSLALLTSTLAGTLVNAALSLQVGGLNAAAQSLVQYAAFSGSTHRTPPRGSSRSPA